MCTMGFDLLEPWLCKETRVAGRNEFYFGAVALIKKRLKEKLQALFFTSIGSSLFAVVS